MADLPAPHTPLHAPTNGNGRPFQPIRPPEGGIDWGRALHGIVHRWWLVLLITLLAGVGGVFGARLLHPQYEATTTIWIDQGARTGTQTSLTSQALFDPQGLVRLMQSNTILDTVVVERHLWLTPARGTDTTLFTSALPGAPLVPGRYELAIDAAKAHYALISATGDTIERGAVSDSVGRTIGLRWLLPSAAIRAGKYKFTIVPPEGVSGLLANALRLSINQQGSFLTASLDGPDPVATAGTLNAIAARYVVVANRMQRQRLTEVNSTLDGQIQYAKKSLDDAEQALQAFRERTITLPQEQVAGGTAGNGPSASDLSPDAAVLTRFHDLQQRLNNRRAERDALANLLQARADTGTVVAAYQAIPSVQQTQSLMTALSELTSTQDSLRRMLVRYTNAYPPVAALRSRVTALSDTTIPALARALLSRLDASSASMTAEVMHTADSLRRMPPRATEQARLMRRVAIATGLYESLQQRHSEAQVAMASSVADVHVLDQAAVPPWPTKDTTPRVVAFAVLAGLGIALFLAMLLDRWDPRFRYPSQVTSDMGLAILGMIPHVRGGNDRQVAAEGDVSFREAIRGVRMNLAFAYGAAGPVTFTVASPGSRDGKSFVSLNLARTFAEGGARTLLVDGDVRRGILHRRCLVSRKPGLTDYLRGGLALDEVAQPTRFEGLHLLTSGTRLHEAPELLASPAMRRLMADLRERFDVIVCDSPPLSAGIDAFALAASTANLLLVLRRGVSDREMTHAKLDVLRRMPIRLLGAVMNDVPDSAPYTYYSHYLAGYETENEKRPALAGRVASEVR